MLEKTLTVFKINNILIAFEKYKMSEKKNFSLSLLNNKTLKIYI